MKHTYVANGYGAGAHATPMPLPPVKGVRCSHACAHETCCRGAAMAAAAAASMRVRCALFCTEPSMCLPMTPHHSTPPPPSVILRPIDARLNTIVASSPAAAALGFLRVHNHNRSLHICSLSNQTFVRAFYAPHTHYTHTQCSDSRASASEANVCLMPTMLYVVYVSMYDWRV